MVHEDSVGLFRMPATDASTIAAVIKDILIRTSLPLSLCRGQAYNGASVMQGKRTGVATRLQEEEEAALPVHFLTHSFNHCLQVAGRKSTVICDSMDIVKEIIKLINLSPKRKTLFGSKLVDNDQAGGTITPLCPTRWTLRTAALESVITQYVSIMDTMHKGHETTRDEYGLKAGGVVATMESFSTLFRLRLGHLLFGAAEETSKALQAIDTSVQEALTSASLLVSFLKRRRTDHSFESFLLAHRHLLLN